MDLIFGLGVFFSFCFLGKKWMGWDERGWMGWEGIKIGEWMDGWEGQGREVGYPDYPGWIGWAAYKRG